MWNGPGDLEFAQPKGSRSVACGNTVTSLQTNNSNSTCSAVLVKMPVIDEQSNHYRNPSQSDFVDVSSPWGRLNCLARLKPFRFCMMHPKLPDSSEMNASRRVNPELIQRPDINCGIARPRTKVGDACRQCDGPNCVHDCAAQVREKRQWRIKEKEPS